MQSTETLPSQSWGQALAQARVQQNRDLGTISRELLLSLAQLRGIEGGQTHAFHGQNFYLRAVEKYAAHLNVTLDPPVSTFQLSSAPGTHPASSPQRASGIARRQSTPPNALQMPAQRAHGARLGRWMALLILALVGAGVYMAVSEGWPSRTVDAVVAQKDGSPADTTGSQVATGTTSSAATGTATSSAPAPAPMAASTSIATSGGTGSPAPSAAPANAQADQAQEPANPTAPVAHQTPFATNLQIQSAGLANKGAGSPQVSANGSETAATNPATVVGANLGESQVASPGPSSDTTPNRAITDEIVLTFDQECWVELLQTDGQSQQRIYKPGEELRIAADQVQRLVLGNAQAIRAQRAGKPFDVTQFTRGSGSVARIDAQALARTAP